LGTFANAAYGIATQVQGSIQFLSVAILNAVTPQITKAEGERDHKRAIHLTLVASKYNFLLMAMVAIPLIAEIPNLLQLWLHKVPDNTVFFCRMMILASLCDQTTISLGALNQAIGNIRNYTLVTFTVKILCIPVSILCIHWDMDVFYVMANYLIFELLSAIIRIPFLMHSAGMKIHDFTHEVLLRVSFPTISMITATWAIYMLLPPASWRFLVTGFVTCVTGGIAIWYTSMNTTEQHHIQGIIQRLNIHKK
jgi:Na+-driven multidrug efflux pump